MYLLVNYQIHVHFWLVEEIISPKKKKQEGELKASSLRINPLHFLSGCGGSNGPQSGRSPPSPKAVVETSWFSCYICPSSAPNKGLGLISLS